MDTNKIVTLMKNIQKMLERELDLSFIANFLKRFLSFLFTVKHFFPSVDCHLPGRVNAFKTKAPPTDLSIYCTTSLYVQNRYIQYHMYDGADCHVDSEQQWIIVLALPSVAILRQLLRCFLRLAIVFTQL
jgi:hypothetical protein